MHPLVLAQAQLPDPSSPLSMGWILAALFALATGALAIKQLFQRTPPLHEEFVTRKEFDSLASRVDAIAAEVSDGFRELDKKRSVSVANLHSAITTLGTQLRGEIKADTAAVHDRINEVLSAVSELKGRVESQQSQTR